LVGVEEEGVGVCDVKRLFVAKEMLTLLCDCSNEALADGVGESLVLLLGLV